MDVDREDVPSDRPAGAPPAAREEGNGVSEAGIHSSPRASPGSSGAVT